MDVKTGNVIRTFEGHPSSVTSVAFSMDGAYVLTVSGKRARAGTEEATARLWNTETGEEAQTFVGHTEQCRSSAALSPDATRVLTGWDHTAKIWDVATGEEIRVFPHERQVLCVAISPGGTHALIGCGDGTARLWDVETGKVIRTFEGHNQRWVMSVAFSPDGAHILTGGDDGLARLWSSGLPPVALSKIGTENAKKTPSATPASTPNLERSDDGGL